MAYVEETARTTGTLITAAIWNQAVKDNMIAVRAGGIAIASQAANEIIFASSTTQFSRSASLTWDGTVLTATNVKPSGAAPATPTKGRLYSDSVVMAWAVVANSGTPSLTDDVNVSGIVDNALGDTTITFATALGSANYAAVASVRTNNNRRHASCYTFATGSVRVYTYDDAANTAADVDFSMIVVGE